jgi:hypothetical protein
MTAVPHSTSTATRIRWIALAATFVLILPIWLVDIVPTQDGPIHLTQGAMIAWFGWGGALAEPIATFYQWNPRIEPNYSVYVILAALIRVLGDPLVAQSVYLTLYGLFFVLTAYWTAKAETDRPILPFLLLLPIAFGLFIHFGFFNYALGFPAFLAFAALWRRIGETRTVFRFLILAVTLFLLGLTHLSTLVAACLLLAAGGIARAIEMLRTSDRRVAAWQFVKDGVWSGAAAAPALGLIVAFLIAYPAATVPASNLRYSIRSVMRRLLTFEYFFSFTWWEVVALAPLIAALIFLVLAAFRRWRSGDLVWPIFVVLIVLVSVLDLKTAQGVPLAERLAAYSWIGAALAIASRQPSIAVARAVGLVAFASLVAQSALRTVAYQSWSQTSRVVLDAGKRFPGQSFVAADLMGRLSANYSWRVQPGVHIHQLAAISSRGVGMGSSLPSMRYYGYYPLRYVPEQDFLFAAPEWEEKPELTSLIAFRRAHKGAPGVLILLGGAGENSVSLAGFHGYDDCTASENTKRSVLVCRSK